MQRKSSRGKDELEWSSFKPRNGDGLLKFLNAEQNRRVCMLANADLEVMAIEADFARHIDKTAEDSWCQVMFKAR